MGKTKYADWLKAFLNGKIEIAVIPDSASDAIHSIHRYSDKDKNLWETAFTYTGRLVVRTGKIGADGVKVNWTPWKTEHEVSIKD